MTHFIGLDISKRKLDVCLLKSKDSYTFHNFNNTAAGHQQLVRFLKAHSSALVVCEPSGGYEKAIVGALHQAGFPIHLVHTLSFHGFAKSVGPHKNDKIDSYKLAYYGKAMEKESNVTASDQTLADLVKRREHLVLHLSNEKRYLAQKKGHSIASCIQDHITYLLEAIHKLDTEIEVHIQKDENSHQKRENLCSVPGIGKVIGAKLLAILPELGDSSCTFSQLTALAGLAPYCRDSGTLHGKRFIRGGRKIPRDALYMAVLSGAHRIPLLKSLKERLLQKGKPKKVAIVACMRKLLAILHSLLKRKENFRPHLA